MRAGVATGPQATNRGQQLSPRLSRVELSPYLSPAGLWSHLGLCSEAILNVWCISGPVTTSRKTLPRDPLEGLMGIPQVQ